MIMISHQRSVRITISLSASWHLCLLQGMIQTCQSSVSILIVEYIECDSKNICPTGMGMVSNGPGCYCKNEQYLYQPTNECVDRDDPRCFPPPALFPSVNLCKLLTNSMTCCFCGMCFALACLLAAVVQDCIEAARPLAITWNPDTPITNYEVRDYTGDLVGETLPNNCPACLPMSFVICVHTCTHILAYTACKNRYIDI